MILAYLISHYLIPGHSNNQKAKLLHPISIFAFILSLILTQIVLQFLPISGFKILGYAANIPPSEVVAITNQKREENGLSRLDRNSALDQAAKQKGEDMLSKDYWAHIAPDGTEPWKFFIDSGYNYRYAGENLARDFSNSSAAVDAWLASPTHRDNLLSSKYSEIGVAVVEGDLDGVDTTIIVQLFGKRYVDTTPQIPIAKADTSLQENNTAKEVIITITPTLVPTSIPEPTQVEESLKPTESQVAPVAALEDIQPPAGQVIISPFTTTKGVSLITVFLLLSVLIVDGIITYKRRVSRIGGRTFAHLAFLGMILAIALIARAGSIL